MPTTGMVKLEDIELWYRENRYREVKFEGFNEHLRRVFDNILEFLSGNVGLRINDKAADDGGVAMRLNKKIDRYEHWFNSQCSSEKELKKLQSFYDEAFQRLFYLLREMDKCQ